MQGTKKSMDLKWVVWKIRSKISFELRKRKFLQQVIRKLFKKPYSKDLSGNSSNNKNLSLNSHPQKMIIDGDLNGLKSSIMRKMRR
jgi:macrodomain Ter protein organizer (MatP/YcbG family)